MITILGENVKEIDKKHAFFCIFIYKMHVFNRKLFGFRSN